MNPAERTHAAIPKVATPTEDNPVVRTQLALIRSLSDELARSNPKDPLSRALREQLHDEVRRLDALVAELMPTSGSHAVSFPKAG